MISRRSDRCVFAALTSQSAALLRVAMVATRSGPERALRAPLPFALELGGSQTRDRKLAIGTRESPPCAQGAARATCSNCVVDAPSASSPSTRAMRGPWRRPRPLRDGLTGSDFDRKATRPAVGRAEIWLLRSDASNPPRPDYARRSRISWFRARLPCECRCFGSSLTASGHGRTRRGPR
jgi:hypothetical protein